MKQTIVWTLLPDPTAPPATDRTVRLSLVISPRLTTDDDPPDAPSRLLSDYTQVKVWPEITYELSVVFKKENLTTQEEDATFIDTPLDTPLWKAIFPLTTPVDPFRFDTSVADDPIQSYPSHLVADSLREKYSRLFAPPDGSRDVARPGAPYAGQSPRSAEQWRAVDRLVDTVAPDPHPQLGQLLHEGVLRDDLATDPAGWARLAEFHTALDPASRHLTAAGPQAPKRDFHGLVAALADHPVLSARIGLIRRVSVKLPDNLPDGPVDIEAHVDPPGFIQSFRPFTKCILKGGRLLLARADGTTGALHLPLDDTSTYTPLDVDVDSGGLALQSYAGMLRRLPRDEPPPEVRPPVLRSDGIFVAEKDRQVAFKKTLERAQGINEDLAEGQQGDHTTVTADNAVQGYRVDVFDEGSGKWYPLCSRVGAYTVHGLGRTIPIDDEGTVTDALARLKDEHGTPISRLHQSVFRWIGWSLAVEPPGKTIGLSGQTADPGAVADPDLPFFSSVSVPQGTLPSLRYGRRYRFRARLVDLAGRAVPFTRQPVDGEPATPCLCYSRYEPVPGPVLVARRPVTQGESIAVLVVRTDNSNPSAPVRGQPCERHLLAPKAAVSMLERHGVIDVAGEHRLDPQVYALLKQRDGGVVTSATTDDAAGGAPYVDADTMLLPWLPDPLSRGIALHGLPGTADVRVNWPHGSAWHEQFPLRLVVQPGGGAVTPPLVVVDSAARLVRVTLDPGATFSTRLSSVLNAGDEQLLRLWNWFSEAPGHTAAEIAAARADALAGRIPQLTPSTEIRMIHAVRCPVEPPVLGQVRVMREPKATAYLLDDPAMQIHDASTQFVHIEAAWREYDDTAESGPIISDGRAVLRQADQDARPAPAPGAPAVATVPLSVRHDLGDTRHRLIQYIPVGTSRFVAYFTERRTVRLTGTGLINVPNTHSFVPGTVVVRTVASPTTAAGTAAEPGDTYSIDHDVRIDYARGTVARIPSGAIADGTRVEVSFVAPPVTRSGPTVPLHVPATVRPPAPVVDSVVPAFSWKESHTGGRLISTRRGGLRVYLKRPWYTSGEGEQLAVMVLGQNAQPDASSDQWATMWGRDPVRLPGAAATMAFLRESNLIADASVQVTPGQAMGYDVHFDESRKLWYADVRFVSDTSDTVYEPFVRLRVARLQQNALRNPDLRLSPVVDTGFIKFPAFRRTFVQVTGDAVEVTVTGPPAPPGASGGGDLSSEVTAAVQVRSSTVGAAGEAIAWRTLDISPTVTLPKDVTVTGDNNGRWRGTIRMPVAPGAGPMRVLVQEYERYQGPADGQISRRIVYLDTLPVEV